MPIYVVGDFSVRFDRPDDPHAKQLRLLVDCYCLALRGYSQVTCNGVVQQWVVLGDTQNMMYAKGLFTENELN